MKILGKIAGLIVGGLVMRLHPIGLIVGLIIGHLIDTGVLRTAGVEAPTRAGFLKPLFGLLGALAKSDGRVSENEIAMVESYMQRMQLGRDERKRAIDAFNLGKQAGFDVHHAARALREFIEFQAELKAAACEMMVRLIEADGEPSAAQTDMTKRIIRSIGLSEAVFDQLRGRPHAHAHTNSGANAGAGAFGRSVRGVRHTASDSEVRRAYRKLITQFHPDKLPKDASTTMRQEAEAKSREINAAYEQIQSLRKMRR